MNRNIIASISKSALQHNLNKVREFAPGKRIIAMVKADAYGHGLSVTVSTLNDVDAFGVACMEEALIIRKQNFSTPIVLMEGIFNESELSLIEQFQLTTVVHAPYQLDMLKHYHGTYQIPVWLKLNSGMNRLGFSYEKLHECYAFLSKHPAIDFMGFLGHFPEANDKKSSATLTQYHAFHKAVKPFSGLRSMANSAAILHWNDTHEDWVRPGLMLYGASPFPNQTGDEFGLRPVMELSTNIIAIQHLKPGDKVGYGGIYQCEDAPKTIAIIGAGYGDGYPWHAQNGTPTLIQSSKAPLCGRVSMDMSAVDITHIPEAQVSDKVILWGRGLPVEHIAKYANTVPWELFCRLNTQRSKIVWEE